MVKKMLENKVATDFRDGATGLTPLHVAATPGTEIFEIQLENICTDGANVLEI